MARWCFRGENYSTRAPGCLSFGPQKGFLHKKVDFACQEGIPAVFDFLSKAPKAG